MLLELLLALTPTTTPDPLNYAMGFDGVVLLRINQGEQYCTGSLLGSGRHILTAASCVAAPPQAIEVVFHLPQAPNSGSEDDPPAAAPSRQPQPDAERSPLPEGCDIPDGEQSSSDLEELVIPSEGHRTESAVRVTPSEAQNTELEERVIPSGLPSTEVEVRVTPSEAHSTESEELIIQSEDCNIPAEAHRSDSAEDNASSEKQRANPAQCSIRREAPSAELKALGMQSVVWCVQRTYFPHQDFTAENQKMLVIGNDGTAVMQSLQSSCPDPNLPQAQPTLPPSGLDTNDIDLTPLTNPPPTPIPSIPSTLPELLETTPTLPELPETIPTLPELPETIPTLPELPEITTPNLESTRSKTLLAKKEDRVGTTLKQCVQPINALAVEGLFDGNGDGRPDQNTVAVLELSAIAPTAADRYAIYRRSPVPAEFAANILASDERGQSFFRVGYATPEQGTKRLGANRYDAYGEELIAASEYRQETFELANWADENPDLLSSSDRNRIIDSIRTQRASCFTPLTDFLANADRQTLTTLAYDVDDGSRSRDIFGSAFCLYDGGVSGYTIAPHLDLFVPETHLQQGEQGSPAFIQGKIAGIASREIPVPYRDPSRETGANVGEYFVDLRVSAYADFIDAVLTSEPGQRLPDQR
ncbi:MAG: hypothetical protein AAGG51_27560 [Cyanobacteria bacterium P01_G01_bin.54]